MLRVSTKWLSPRYWIELQVLPPLLKATAGKNSASLATWASPCGKPATWQLAFLSDKVLRRWERSTKAEKSVLCHLILDVTTCYLMWLTWLTNPATMTLSAWKSRRSVNLPGRLAATLLIEDSYECSRTVPFKYFVHVLAHCKCPLTTSTPNVTQYYSPKKSRSFWQII